MADFEFLVGQIILWQWFKFWTMLNFAILFITPGGGA
jgi:hypothetical protein